jgi:lipopolysaccharide biosynthesis glycosyltransferase
MKTAVATICIGSKNQAMRRLTFPSIIDFAERIGADFINMSQTFEDRFDGILNYEKLQFIKLLEIYDRVIYLDADILVSRDCPNPIDQVPPHSIGAFITSRYSSLHNHTNLEIIRALGDIEWQREGRDASVLESFNSGVLVLSKQLLPALKQALPAADAWCQHSRTAKPHTLLKDQPVLNYITQKNCIPIHDLSYRFNHTNARGGSADRFASYVIHYAGVSHRQESRRFKTTKLEKMRIDAKILSIPWLHRLAKRSPRLVRVLDSLV